MVLKCLPSLPRFHKPQLRFPDSPISISISITPFNLFSPPVKMSEENIGEKPDASTAEMLRRIQTAESVLLPIPRDAFEKLYLNPKTPTSGNLQRTFGNPTPISLLGFLLSATPAAMITMGWRGAGGDGGAIL